MNNPAPGSHSGIYEVSSEWARRAYVDHDKYQVMYEESIRDPEVFWRGHGDRLDWFPPFTRVKNATFGPGEISIRWFEDGVTNVAYNCVDRHLKSRGEQVAIIGEGDDPSESKRITYRQLHREVCRMANVLRNRGVKRGGRVNNLSADDSGGRLRDARLRPARRYPFGCFRRLFARLARNPNRG